MESMTRANNSNGTGTVVQVNPASKLKTTKTIIKKNHSILPDSQQSHRFQFSRLSWKPIIQDVSLFGEFVETIRVL